MSYMFLDKNALIVVDYIPGSSGRLLMRCLAEMDSAIDYHNPCIMSHQINENPASLEIDFHTIPKRYFNWYLHKQPSYDINVIFDQIGCFSVADRERSKFYPRDYDMSGERIYFGVHSWATLLDYQMFHPNVSYVSIVPQTEIGIEYQNKRARACYPYHYDVDSKWVDNVILFNSKQHKECFDFCTALATKDTEMTIEWIKAFLGNYRTEKIDTVKNILEIYYKKVVDFL